VPPSNLIKVVAAFVAGVVVALGSALIFVRVSDTNRTQPTMIQAGPAQLPDAGSDTSGQGAQPTAASDQRSDTGDTEAAPEPRRPKAAAKSTVAPRWTSTPRSSVPAVRDIAKVPAHRNQPPYAPVEVAQNTPPAAGPSQVVAAPPQSVPAPAADVQQPLAVQTPPPMQYPEQQAQPAIAPARQPHVVTLEPGTTLNVRLGETLSTDHNYTGDTFRGTLESPVIMDGFIIAEKGSKVLGRVVNAQKAGRVQGVADLTLALTELNTTDGQRVRIETSSYDKKGPTSTGRDTAEIAGGAALGAIIGAAAGGGKGAAIGAGAGGAAGTGAVLTTRGKPAALATESRLSFRLANAVTITEKLNY